jgi:hypothetical protein
MPIPEAGHLALAPTTALVTEADKLTLGQELTVSVPASVLTVSDMGRKS